MTSVLTRRGHETRPAKGHGEPGATLCHQQSRLCDRGEEWITRTSRVMSEVKLSSLEVVAAVQIAQ